MSDPDSASDSDSIPGDADRPRFAAFIPGVAGAVHSDRHSAYGPSEELPRVRPYDAAGRFEVDPDATHYPPAVYIDFGAQPVALRTFPSRIVGALITDPPVAIGGDLRSRLCVRILHRLSADQFVRAVSTASAVLRHLVQFFNAHLAYEYVLFSGVFGNTFTRSSWVTAAWVAGDARLRAILHNLPTPRAARARARAARARALSAPVAPPRPASPSV